MFVAFSAPEQGYNSLKTASFHDHVGILFRSQFLLRYGEKTREGPREEVFGGKSLSALVPPVQSLNSPILPPSI